MAQLRHRHFIFFSVRDLAGSPPTDWHPGAVSEWDHRAPSGARQEWAGKWHFLAAPRGPLIRSGLCDGFCWPLLSHVPLNPGAFPLRAPLGRVLCRLALFLHVQTAEERKTESALPHCPPILQSSYSTFLFLPSPITELVLSLGSSLNLCLAHSNISLYISSLQTLFISFYQISNKLKFPLTLKQQQKFPSSPINSTHVLFFFFSPSKSN